MESAGVGCWSVVLSRLPHLYPACSSQHLGTVADLILQVLVHHTPHNTEPGRVDITTVVRAFLLSECFPELRTLHETLMSRYLAGIKNKGCVGLYSGGLAEFVCVQPGPPLRQVVKLCGYDRVCVFVQPGPTPAAGGEAVCGCGYDGE